MTDAFMRAFLQARDDSCAACVIEWSGSSPEYEEVQRECTRLFEEINKKMNDGGALMEQYEAAVNRRGSMEENWIYRRGFEDCMNLLKWMEAFKAD